MSLDDFKTRERANRGTKVPLFYPDGTRSDHWLVVRSEYSDAYRRAEARAIRKAADAAQIEDADERSLAFYELKLEAISALVVDWSFEETFSEGAVLEFLREAPQIADKVDEIAKKKRLFFKRESISSPSMPDKLSN